MSLYASKAEKHELVGAEQLGMWAMALQSSAQVEGTEQSKYALYAAGFDKGIP